MISPTGKGVFRVKLALMGATPNSVWGCLSLKRLYGTFTTIRRSEDSLKSLKAEPVPIDKESFLSS
jgi:hypothetical protein